MSLLARNPTRACKMMFSLPGALSLPTQSCLPVTVGRSSSTAREFSSSSSRDRFHMEHVKWIC